MCRFGAAVARTVAVGAFLYFYFSFHARAAQASCRLELVPADAPADWARAAEAAAARLASLTTLDCGSVEVAVRPSGGALLTFLTTDGRRAVRALLSPEEIAPALDALLVTSPADLASPASPSSSSSPPSPAPSPAPPRASPNTVRRSDASTAAAGPALPAVPSPEVHFIIGGSAGARFGLAGAYLSPAIALRPSGTFGAWELAASVEYDPSYSYLPGGLPAGWNLWSLIAGVEVGRREAVGPLSIGYGLGVGVASIREEVDGPSASTKVADFGQPRLSAYARLVAPRSAPVRPTFELALDAAVANLKKRATLDNDLPNLPRFGVLVTAGVETSAL